jgi:hypothetical protein
MSSYQQGAELAALETLLTHAETTTELVTGIAEQQRVHGEALQRIETAVQPAATDGESQLETLLRTLVRQGQEHGEALVRIEATLRR